MSWISDNHLNWIQRIAANILKHGPIPQHIGIIMDGNRRFARSRALPVIYGHREGFKKLSDTMCWLSDIGVKEVTFYAFSIENFKRDKEEVNNLMKICSEKLEEMLSDREEMRVKGLRIRPIGNLSLLPSEVSSLFVKVAESSKQNTKILLNIAVAYTAREEMTNAVNIVLNKLKNGNISEKDLNAELLGDYLYTSDSPPVGLILRTSGEMRLSDFFLFQGSYSYLHITSTFWPQFSPLNLLWAIFKYQRVFKTLYEAWTTSSYNMLINNSN